MPRNRKTTKTPAIARKFKDTRRIEILDPEDDGRGFSVRAERGYGRFALVLTDFGSGEVMRF